MDRYWRELEREFRKPEFGSFAVHCPFGNAPAESHRAPRLERIWNKYFRLPWKVSREREAQVVHVLDHSSAHFLKRVPASAKKIVTVHDLAPLEDPDGLTSGQLKRFRRTVQWLNHADILLAVSEYTKKSLRSFLTASPRIAVLPMGVNVAGFSVRHGATSPVALPQCRKILSVGSCLKRKNLDVLPEVLSRVCAATGPVALIRVGELLPQDLRERLIAVLAPGNLVELGQLSDDQLVAVYQSSDVLLFPSRLEGFGLPVAEAMAAGCPVVCSRAASLQEVGRDAALYFDPSDPAGAAARIGEIFRDENLRATLVERGQRRAQELSWENHATQLSKIYVDAINPAGK